MIAQFLNEEFLLGAAEDTRLELKNAVDKRERRESVDAGPLADLTDEKIREVIDELNRVVAEADATAGSDHKDAWVCMPREPILAILQAVLTEVAVDQRPDAFADDPGGPTQR